MPAGNITPQRAQACAPVTATVLVKPLWRVLTRQPKKAPNQHRLYRVPQFFSAKPIGRAAPKPGKATGAGERFNRDARFRNLHNDDPLMTPAPRRMVSRRRGNQLAVQLEVAQVLLEKTPLPVGAPASDEIHALELDPFLRAIHIDLIAPNGGVLPLLGWGNLGGPGASFAPALRDVFDVGFGGQHPAGFGDAEFDRTPRGAGAPTAKFSQLVMPPMY